MKVAIAGAGSVGVAVATALKRRGHDVLLLERNTDIVEKQRSSVDVRWAVADACEVSSLQAAGLMEMDVMVAATGDDEDNLVISLLAKQEFAVPRVIARVNSSRNQWLFTESWGVDVSVSTPLLYTSLVEEAVAVGELVHLLSFENGTHHLLEVTLSDDSPACGTALSDLDLPRDCAIAAVVRKDHVIMPDSDTVLHAGDEIVILANTEMESRITGLLCKGGAAPSDDQAPIEHRTA